jgi:hypothetical protein
MTTQPLRLMAALAPNGMFELAARLRPHKVSLEVERDIDSIARRIGAPDIVGLILGVGPGSDPDRRALKSVIDQIPATLPVLVVSLTGHGHAIARGLLFSRGIKAHDRIREESDNIWPMLGWALDVVGRRRMAREIPPGRPDDGLPLDETSEVPFVD